MRMTEYPEASAVASEDVLIIDGQDGNRKVKAAKALEPLLVHGTSTNGHRVIPECNFLGNAVTNAQAQAIYDGSFDGLHVGDYWTMSGHNWRIWDFDVWLNEGGNTTHHIVLLPDDCLYDAKMNDTATTSSGYVGSKMYTTNLTQARTLINNLFGDLLFSHKEYLSNAVTNGKISGSIEKDCIVEIPTETMLYGSLLKSSAISDGSLTGPADYTHKRLLLSYLMAEFVVINHHVWLRDVTSNEAFCYLSSFGGTGYSNATSNLGVRPYFCLKGRVAG